MLVFTLFAFTLFAPKKDKLKFSENSSVYNALKQLGLSPVTHEITKIDTQLARYGYEIIHNGQSNLNKKRQSKHFTCRSCHNVVREDDNLSHPTPEDRLKYGLKNDLPFLQGTTLWGIVNRESYYNGDYVKKYGSKVEKANKNLENAIQLCATECAQGRALNKEELNAVLHYLWTLELKFEDLILTKQEKEAIHNQSNNQAIDLIKSKYLQYSPATFVDQMQVRTKKGSPEHGRYIYEKSCMHCHNSSKGVTNFTLDVSSIDLKFLAKNLDTYNKYSIYWITRYGTHPVAGYKPYMPHYTKERLSDQQIEDLAAYISTFN